jgi:predicted amidohydrolase
MPRLAAIQMETEPLEPAPNVAKVIEWLGRAAEEGAHLAVFPECALTGYFLTPDECFQAAEPVPGPRTDHIQEACRRTGLHALVGTLEVDEARQLFNTAVLVGPQGMLAKYRKTHLLCLGLDRHVRPGDLPLEPVETPQGKLGLLTCYDLRFPEPARALALKGAQAILLPTAWPAAATLYPNHVARTRAAENGVFLVAADHVGEERGRSYLGRSLIVGPDGEILAEAGTSEETLLIADVDLRRSDEKRRVFVPGEYEINLFADRRPELYAVITGED